MKRMLSGVVVAGAAAAGAALGQVALGRWSRVVVPDQSYSAGNDTWPFQLVLLAWCSASAAVIGTVMARSVVEEKPWRYVVLAAAGSGALAPLPLATGWASRASDLGHNTVAAAAAAMALGAFVGAAVGATTLAWRGLGRCAAVWLGWVWLNVAAEVVIYEPPTGRDYHVPVNPLGMLTPIWPVHNPVAIAALLSSLPPAVLLGWWAKRRGDRAPLLGVMLGPLLLLSVHLVVPPLPGGHSDGDHYSLQSDLFAWLLAAILALGAGALAAALAGRVPAGRGGSPQEAGGEDGDAKATDAGRLPVESRLRCSRRPRAFSSRLR